MSWEDKITDPEERLVFQALSEPDCTWRAVDAIANETGLAEELVLAIVRKYDGTLTVESDSRSLTGEPLVALIANITKSMVRQFDEIRNQRQNRVAELIRAQVKRHLGDLQRQNTPSPQEKSP